MTGRRIKSDETPEGVIRYDAAVRALTKLEPTTRFYDEALNLVPSP